MVAIESPARRGLPSCFSSRPPRLFHCPLLWSDCSGIRAVKDLAHLSFMVSKYVLIEQIYLENLSHRSRAAPLHEPESIRSALLIIPQCQTFLGIFPANGTVLTSISGRLKIAQLWLNFVLPGLITKVCPSISANT